VTIARVAKVATKGGNRAGKALEKPEHRFEDELMVVAEQLIVKGKEQGYLTPDDILQGFPEIDAEPDQIFRIFAAFKEIGIEVTDGEKDFEEVEQIDDEMLLDIEMMDSVSLDDPVRMYLKEIGRVSLLTANDEVELAQAIEAKPLHDALKALNVIEEIDGRQRSVEEMLPDVIERLATVKRKGQQAHIAVELLGLNDLAKLQDLQRRVTCKDIQADLNARVAELDAQRKAEQARREQAAMTLAALEEEQNNLRRQEEQRQRAEREREQALLRCKSAIERGGIDQPLAYQEIADLGVLGHMRFWACARSTPRERCEAVLVTR